MSCYVGMVSDRVEGSPPLGWLFFKVLCSTSYFFLCVYPVIYSVLLSLFGWLLASHSALHFQLGLILMSQKFCSNSSLLSPLIWRCHDVRPSWRRIQRQSPRPLEMRLYMPISSHVSMLSWAVFQYISTRFHLIFWIYWCTCWLWNLNLVLIFVNRHQVIPMSTRFWLKPPCWIWWFSHVFSTFKATSEGQMVKAIVQPSAIIMAIGPWVLLVMRFGID